MENEVGALTLQEVTWAILNILTLQPMASTPTTPLKYDTTPSLLVATFFQNEFITRGRDN